MRVYTHASKTKNKKHRQHTRFFNLKIPCKKLAKPDQKKKNARNQTSCITGGRHEENIYSWMDYGFFFPYWQFNEKYSAPTKQSNKTKNPICRPQTSININFTFLGFLNFLKGKYGSNSGGWVLPCQKTGSSWFWYTTVTNKLWAKIYPKLYRYDLMAARLYITCTVLNEINEVPMNSKSYTNKFEGEKHPIL